MNRLKWSVEGAESQVAFDSLVLRFILWLFLGPDLETDYFLTLGLKWSGGRILRVSFLAKNVGIESIGRSVGLLVRGIGDLCLAQCFGGYNSSFLL